MRTHGWLLLLALLPPLAGCVAPLEPSNAAADPPPPPRSEEFTFRFRADGHAAFWEEITVPAGHASYGMRTLLTVHEASTWAGYEISLERPESGRIGCTESGILFLPGEHEGCTGGGAASAGTWKLSVAGKGDMDVRVVVTLR